MTKTARKTITAIIVAIVAVIIFLVIWFPMLWAVSTSFKPKNEVYKVPPVWIPQHPTLENYRKVWTGRSAGGVTEQGSPWGCYITNSLIVTGVTVIFTMILATFAGYSLARFKFPGRTLIFILFIASQMFPGPMVMVPIYGIMVKLGLYNTLVGLIVIYTASVLPFTTLVSVGSLRNIPLELEESAMIDGCSRMGVFFRIVLPLSKIAVTTTGIFAFLMSFGEYAFAVVLITGSKRFTVPLGLARYITAFDIYWNEISATILTIAIPLIFIFLAAQKHFTKGIIAGSLKG